MEGRCFAKAWRHHCGAPCENLLPNSTQGTMSAHANFGSVINLAVGPKHRCIGPCVGKHMKSNTHMHVHQANTEFCSSHAGTDAHADKTNINTERHGDNPFVSSGVDVCPSSCLALNNSMLCLKTAFQSQFWPSTAAFAVEDQKCDWKADFKQTALLFKSTTI